MPEVERLIRRHGKLRMLFDTTGFHGLDAGWAWVDFKFGGEHFADIEQLATLDDKEWRQGRAW